MYLCLISTLAIGFLVSQFITNSYPVVAFGGYATIRHSRLVESHVATSDDPILVLFTPNTTGDELSFGVSFDSDYVISGTNTNITVTTSGLPSTHKGTTVVAWPGIGTTATAVSTDNVTFSSTALTDGTLYGFFITAGVTSPSSVGSSVNILSTHNDGSPDFSGYVDKIDKFSTAVYTVSSNGASTDSDQIVLSARVLPTYTFSLSANSILLDTQTSTVEYPGTALNTSVSPVTATASTNANSGHTIWIRSSTSSGLSSVTTASSIAFAGSPADATVSTLSPGTAGVVVDIDIDTNTSGSLTIATEFDGTGNDQGGTPSTSFQEIAKATGPVDIAGDKVDIMPRIAISGVTLSADDYTQTFTIVGAANI